MCRTAGARLSAPSSQRVVAALAIVVVLLLAACDGGDEDPTDIAGIDNGGDLPTDEGGDDQDSESAQDDDPSRGGTDGPEDGREERILWFLPPAGPDIPENAERDVYYVLEAAVDRGCRDELTGGILSEPAPADFETGHRSYHLYRSGAHLCAGEVEAAGAAFTKALGFSWTDPTDEATQGRVCRVWEAVTQRIDAAAGPCTLEVTATDDEPSGEEPPEEDTEADPPDETDRLDGPEERNALEDDRDEPEPGDGQDDPGRDDDADTDAPEDP